MAIKLNVHGPFHFDQLVTMDEFNIPGFYIWGFVYGLKTDSTEHLLGNIYDFSSEPIHYNHKEMRFIPYYVGKSEKNKGVLGRLNDHHKGIVNGTANYICFSEEYMKEFFFNKSGYPIHKSNNFVSSNYHILMDLVKDKNNPAITYHSHAKILEHIYGNHIRNTKITPPLCTCGNYPTGTKLAQPKNCPKCKKLRKDGNQISSLKLKNKDFKETGKATLYKYVSVKKNFWAYYCTSEDLDQNVDLEKRYHRIENYIYYSLKGKTTSMAEGYCPDNGKIDLDGKSIDIELNLTNDKAEIFKKEPSYNFPGYL
jgi:hypothetical protein